jgi:SAM-dependent methyltransferase
MPEIFTADSPFVVRDNRRFRPVLPTTARTLNRRHSLLMPPRVLKGRTVLDLGCCLGATGYWALSLGAKGYHGVEHQRGYADEARRLFAGKRNAKVVREDAVRYLARSTGRYGVVAIMGLLHGLYDPLFALWEAARRAERYLCFEDFGRRGSAPAMVANPLSPMPVAGEAASTVGFGWEIGPKAMEAIMDFLGFGPDMKPVFIAENRWLCRYARTGPAGRASSYSGRWVPWKR